MFVIGVGMRSALGGRVHLLPQTMQMLVQRDPCEVRRRMHCRQRHPQDRIRTKLFLAGVPSATQPPVDFLLIVDLDADHGSPKLIPDILHSPPDPATVIPAKITVPHSTASALPVLAPEGTIARPRPPAVADNFHLYRRIRATIERFAWPKTFAIRDRGASYNETAGDKPIELHSTHD